MEKKYTIIWVDRSELRKRPKDRQGLAIYHLSKEMAAILKADTKDNYMVIMKEEA